MSTDLLTDPKKIVQDCDLIARYPFPDKARELIVNRLLRIVLIEGHTPREVTSAARALASLDRVNQEERRFAAEISQPGPASPPFDQSAAQLFLEFAKLHRQRRLANADCVGCAAEMARSSDSEEIAKLTKSDHRNKNILSLTRINMIGF